MGMNYVIDGKLDPGGVETDRRARKYSEQHGVNYADAIRAVVREQRNYAAKDMWPDANDVNQPVGISQAYRSLADVAAGAGHDAAEASRRINAIFDKATIALAAQFIIEREKNRIVGNMSPGMTTANLQNAYRQVASEIPAVWSIYENNGPMTPEAVSEMFWQRKFFSSENDVRRYSADHVKYDASGNQFRTYVR